MKTTVNLTFIKGKKGGMVAFVSERTINNTTSLRQTDSVGKIVIADNTVKPGVEYICEVEQMLSKKGYIVRKATVKHEETAADVLFKYTPTHFSKLLLITVKTNLRKVSFELERTKFDVLPFNPKDVLKGIEMPITPRQKALIENAITKMNNVF